MFRHETGNWVDYRRRFNLSRDDEIDLHLGPGIARALIRRRCLTCRELSSRV